MARAQVQDGKLRGCPTCGTPIDAAALGMRDFSWVNEALPGKVGGMDIDFIISQVRDKGESMTRVLMLELKPGSAPISHGARLTFREFVRVRDMCVDAWAVWDQGDGTVVVGEFDVQGDIRNKRAMTKDELADTIGAWWDAGYHEGACE